MDIEKHMLGLRSLKKLLVDLVWDMGPLTLRPGLALGSFLGFSVYPLLCQKDGET